MVDMVKLHSQLKDVPLSKMRVSQNAQRKLKPSRIDELHADFDLELLGYPVVNFRDGFYWIIDGQHRVETTKRFLGEGWEKQSITCRAYTGMTEKEEAAMFRRLNNNLSVSAFDKFNVGVTEGDAECVAVKKAIERAGLHLGREKGDGSVSSVGTLAKIFRRANGETVTRALRIVHNAFGDPGLTNQVIDGVAMVCERYNGAINDDESIERLNAMRGGVGALMSRAGTLRKQTGNSATVCIAAATVDVLNAKRGGKKLPSWWKE